MVVRADSNRSEMTQSSRIVLNTLASYGRSLLALAFGLFSTRWVLAALGKEDLGLYGLMGSCIVFISLINGILGGTIARFYAYSIGERQKLAYEDGRELMRRWFNAAFSIHAFLPIILAVLVYPVGTYALRHWLVVPSDRIDSCIWVFRMVLLSSCINMAAVPYVAMYRAKQLIVELSIWETVRTVVMFVCAYLLLSWRYDKLIAYAAYMTFVPSLISFFQVIRARIAFDACIIRLKYFFSPTFLVPMFLYAFGDLFGSLGSVVRDNGTAFLINLKFGPSMNASFGIASQVSSHTTALSSAMIGAIVPAVTTAEGSGDHQYALRLAFRSIKFGVALILIFCIPLILEIDEVLRIWLVEPPEGAAQLCKCMLVAFVCHKLGWGHHLAILAKGKVVGAQLLFGLTSAMGVLLSWLLIQCNMGVWGVGLSFILIFALMTIERVFCARRLCDMPVRPWITQIVLPLCLVIGLAYLAGQMVVCAFPQSFIRVCATTCASNIVLLLLLYFLVMDKDERRFLVTAIDGVRRIKKL